MTTTADGGRSRDPDARPTILLTGAAGQVGWELRRTLSPLGRVVSRTRAELDLRKLDAVREQVRAERPAVIVNAAAYTAVDQAEDDRDAAFAVNHAAPGVLAEEAVRVGALMVHYSTDYVFDGMRRTPYTESDEPHASGVYGESKLGGDRAVIAAGGPHLIFRTSWVYGLRGRNFLRTVLRLAHARDELRIVDDQIGAPTPAALLGVTTALVLARCAAGAGFELPERQWGIFNVATRGETSWFGFAERILALDPNRAAQCCRTVTPITTADCPTRAIRPAYSVLDPARLEQTFGMRMPDWSDQLGLVMGGLGIDRS